MLAQLKFENPRTMYVKIDFFVILKYIFNKIQINNSLSIAHFIHINTLF